jgi:subtilisin family serine protease
MVAAGTAHNSPLGQVSGIAPKAFLGNYKIFGSPGVNDVTFDDALIQALEDAISDGMHIAVLALGSPAIWSPDDRGPVCGVSSDRPCDPRAEAVENAIRRGLTVVVSAGNDGDAGIYAPSFNSIHSPATAPSAISVGASTNSQLYYSSMELDAPAPPALVKARGLFGDGPRLTAPLRAPVRDVTSLQDDGKACQPLGNGTLTGTIALIQRGDCSFPEKVHNAQRAGAVAVLIQQRSGSDFVFPPAGLGGTGIPTMMIGASAGEALAQLLANSRDHAATLNPALFGVAQDPDFIAYFSSYGPSISRGGIKPEITAAGMDVYAATQRFDPNGDMFNPTGYMAVQGTSFSAPMVAGAAALFKQRFPEATPAQVKSAVVNTAADVLSDYDVNNKKIAAGTLAAGAGRLDATGPARTNLTIEPSVLSFGTRTGAQNPSLSFRVNNHSANAINVQLQVRPYLQNPAVRAVLSEASFRLEPRTSRQITARIEGTSTTPGVY